MKQMLSAAIKFAVEKHDGQFDQGGNPYILHCLKVMHYLKTDDEELMCIAVLHDVIEDCFLIYDDGIDALFNIGMSERVVNGVELLTKDSGIPYQEYLENIANNKDAIRVKMADLRHNMDIRRLKGVTEKDTLRLAKYSKAYEFLKCAMEKGSD